MFNNLSIHKKSIPELLAYLDTSEKGLTNSQLGILRQKYGFNLIPEKKKGLLFFRFAKNLVNLFALLLWLASFLALIGEILEPGQGMLFIAIALVAVIFINALFIFYREYKAERTLEAFKTLMPPKAIVVRDSKEQIIFANELLPGDLILLSEGDKIPADAILIEANALKVNNSSLTGESEPQLRSLKPTHENIMESRNVVFSGTIVSAGNGKAIVFSTGEHTELGKIAKTTLEIAPVTTPLHRELQYFIKIITILAVFLGVCFFITGFFVGNTFWMNLIFAIGIIVANVPEGLLPTVTLALSMASLSMAKKNVLVKSLESVETLGSTTVICTDKTGTLTTGEMQVKSVYLNLSNTPSRQIDLKEKSDSFQKLFDIITLCNNASLINEPSGVIAVGDPTETAMLLFAHQFINVQEIRKIHKREYEIPFDSKIKKMITVNSFGSERLALLKGAPEILLKNCSMILLNGEGVQLTPDKRYKIEQQINDYANAGGRIIALAYKITASEIVESSLLENGYIFVGLINMYDPPRPGVTEAVSKCHQAGIKVLVFSGDHPLTVKSISQEVKIVSDKDPSIIMGDDINKMSHTELINILKLNDIVFARTSPAQKLRIVLSLQQQGHVVAVTGDGVNDAPALKRADIGIAMGKSGTDVAKEAADMILMDDHFATIVYAIEQGRRIYDNIKKFIAYILTSNIPEIVPFIAFVLFKIPLSLTIILILVIDLGTDLLPAIGLGQERSETDVMKNPPRNRNERLLTGKLLFMSYGIVGMLQALAGFFAYFYVLLSGGWTWGQHLAYSNPLYQEGITAYFFSIIIVQIANVLACRTRRQSALQMNFFSNRLLLLGIAVELLIGCFIVYTPFAHTVFNTHSLSIFELSLSLPFAFIIYFGDEIRKYYLRKDNYFVKKYLTW